jgi:hypothetical protein
MIKFFTSFLLVLFITGTSFAQEPDNNIGTKPQVPSGIQFRAGIGYTGYVGYMSTGGLALNAGILWPFHGSRFFKFYPEATLAIRHESDSGNNLTQVNVDIPLPMRLKFGHFFFSFGPFLSINLYDSADRIIPEVGALLGMGITSSSFDIEARMTEGITDVYATSGYDDDDTFSKTLQFQILFSRWL